MQQINMEIREKMVFLKLKPNNTYSISIKKTTKEHAKTNQQRRRDNAHFMEA